MLLNRRRRELHVRSYRVMPQRFLPMSCMVSVLAIAVAALFSSSARADAASQIIRLQWLPALGKVAVDMVTRSNVRSGVGCKDLGSLNSRRVRDKSLLDRFRRKSDNCALMRL